MKLYIIHETSGGFAREDASVSHIVGATTDDRRAKQMKSWWGHSTITEIELDYLPPGYINFCEKVLKKAP